MNNFVVTKIYPDGARKDLTMRGPIGSTRNSLRRLRGIGITDLILARSRKVYKVDSEGKPKCNSKGKREYYYVSVEYVEKRTPTP